MLWATLLAVQSACVAAAYGMQHYPAVWGHYDVCKSQMYTEEGLTWDYMACQPEAVDMTKYLRVTIHPHNITCGDPPETYCALEVRGGGGGGGGGGNSKGLGDADSLAISFALHPEPLPRESPVLPQGAQSHSPAYLRQCSGQRKLRRAAVQSSPGPTEPPGPGWGSENPYMCNNECDASTEELAPPEELMFDFEGRNPTTFWQSTSWKKYPKPLQVNLTLSWNKTIELTDDIILTFESGRPEQMVLEKSLDQGRTWTPYQFYATDCLDAFTMEPKTVSELTQHTLLDIICTEDYSRGYVWKNDKTVRFEIKGRFALFAGPRLHNMASLYGQLDTTKTLRDFFTITDLRIRLLKPATGATMVDENNLSRYFYAISDIKVQGR
ncbi:hypothetical protein CRUP_005059 [Coryphaenoides rupestris]|nr:hypothetical protein CRUP_005059 [Coryphaenoides rupestris]